MAESAADRQRRYRRHKAGDHQLCVPGRCADVTPIVTDDVTPPERDTEPEQRPQLGESGSQLWREMTADGMLPPMQSVLLLEACRIADRLDQLDRHLSGEDWLRFEADQDSGTVTVVIDRVLAEARQQASALKAITAELRQAQGAGGRSGNTSKPADAGQGVTGIADLSARIAQRRASSSG